MRIRVTIRIGQWLLVALAMLLLAGGLFAILVLDASANKALAGERGSATGQPTALEGE